MARVADVMREVHRLRRFAVELQEQLERLPRQQKIQRNRVTAAETALKEGQDAVKQLKATVALKESELKSTHARATKHERQLDEAADKKAYDALRTEIANERAACGQLEEEILATIVASEEKAAEIPALEQAVQKAKQEFAAFEQSLDERRAGLEAQLSSANEQLRQVEAEVPSSVRVQFERIVTTRGVDGFAGMNKRCCSACYTEVTAQSFQDIQQGNFVMCKSCGRVLYPSADG